MYPRKNQSRVALGLALEIHEIGKLVSNLKEIANKTQ